MKRKPIISSGNVAALVLIMAALYGGSLYSYLLFHGLVDLFSVVVAFGIFMLAWNARRVLRNNYLLFLGIAYFFVGLLDLVHTLTYKGMGFMPAGGANLPTQLHISARYLESLAMLAAVPLALDREVRPGRVFLGFSAVTAALLGAISLGIFPDCFIEGVGLTPFKKASEYVIAAVLVAALWLLHRRRHRFDARIYRLVAVSIIFTIGAELAFSFYISVYGIPNLVGHFLKFLSFYCIYKALVETGFREPYELLFQDLKASEERLRQREEEFRSMFELSAVGMAQIDPETQRFARVNRRFCEITGYGPAELGELPFSALTHPDDRRQDDATFAHSLGSDMADWSEEVRYIRKDGQVIWVRITGRLIRDELGRPWRSVAIIEDVTERIHTRQALAESEWRFRSTWDNAAVGMAHVSLKGRWLRVNRTLCAILGYTPEELAEKTFHEISFAEDLQRDLPAGTRLVSGELDHYTTEKRYRHKQGYPIWASVTASLQRDEEGRPQHFIAVIQDISERKRIEQALRESEEKFRLISRSIRDVIWLGTPGIEQILYVNPAYEEIWGRSCESLYRSPASFVEAIHADDRQAVRDGLARHTGGRWNYRYRVVRPDGSQRWIEDTGVPVVDEHGIVRLMVGVARDITDRREAEAVKERHLQRLQTLLLVSASVLSAGTTEEMLQKVVDAGIELTGARYGTGWHGFCDGSFQVGAVAGATDGSLGLPGDLFVAERGGVYMELIEQATTLRLTEEELVAHPQWWGVPSNHVALRGLLGVSLVGRDGTPEGLIMVTDKIDGEFTDEDEVLLGQLASLASIGLQHLEARDEAEAKASEAEAQRRQLGLLTEELKRSNEDLGQFASIVSHDLQEPLRTVKGFVQLLRRRYGDRLDDKANEFIDMAVEGACRMERLLRDLLAYSRVGTAGRPQRLVPLEPLVGEALDNLKAAIDASRAEVECRGLPSVWADATQVVQLFQNLIGNAIKFHGDRPPRIEISAEQQPGEWLVRVRDNGIGIEPKDFERVFLVFSRLHRRGDYPGTGIGLAVCKKIVERHGGRIWVEPAAGAGTTFCFTLPAGEGAAIVA